MSVRDIRILVVAILAAIALVWGVLTYRNIANKVKVAEGHETFVESVEKRDEVSSTAHEAFKEAKKSSAARHQSTATARREANAITEKVANEDPDVRAFLATPIPHELRSADRKARESRRLGRGDGARGGSGSGD